MSKRGKTLDFLLLLNLVSMRKQMLFQTRLACASKESCLHCKEVFFTVQTRLLLKWGMNC